MRSAAAKRGEKKQCRRVGKIRKKKEKERKKKSPASKSVKSSSRIKEEGGINGREEEKLHIKLLMRTAVEILTTPVGDAKRAAAAASRLILAAE